jgi:hypothetical protein
MQLQGEIAGPAIPANKVSQRSSTLLYGRSEYLLYMVRQAVVARTRHTSRTAPGIYSGQEQHFISVNITNPDYDPAVHNE